MEAKTKGRSFNGSDWVVECVVGFEIRVGVWIQMETFGDLAQLTSIEDAKCWRGQVVWVVDEGHLTSSILL